jgi:hypothetical protein
VRTGEREREKKKGPMDKTVQTAGRPTVLEGRQQH